MTAPERLIDFLHGAGPNEDGLWFDEVAEREKGALWWRKYLRQLERLHATEVAALAAEKDAMREARDEWASRAIHRLDELISVKARAARMTEALRKIASEDAMDPYAMKRALETARAALTDTPREGETLFIEYDEWVNAINDLDDHWGEDVVPPNCTIVSKNSATLAMKVLDAVAKRRRVVIKPDTREGETR